MRLSLIFLAIGLLLSGCSAPDADRIYVNAVIWTANPDAPSAEAMAVSNGRIAAIGSEADIRALAGAKTEIVDLNGAFVVPGFIDNHTHFLSGGMTLASVDLRSAATPEAFSEAMSARTGVEEILAADCLGYERELGPMGVPRLLTDELRRHGRDIPMFASELEAVHAALDMARTGDTVLLLVKGQRAESLDAIREAGDSAELS